MMNLLYQNKVLLNSLLIYLVGQLLFWYLGGVLQPILLIGQEVAYIVALIYSIKLLAKKQYRDKKWILINLIRIFFITNLLLLLHWVFVVYFNPEINWKLQGNDYEVDPWYYILYVPVLNFLISFLFLVLAQVAKKSVLKK